MKEKAYKSMQGVGALNIAVGIVILVSGVVSGILLIVGGGRLLKNKSEILF